MNIKVLNYVFIALCDLKKITLELVNILINVQTNFETTIRNNYYIITANC